jgi:hypothetical protein
MSIDWYFFTIDKRYMSLNIFFVSEDRQRKKKVEIQITFKILLD